MVVKKNDITSIIYRCRVVFPYQLGADIAARTIEVWRKNYKCCATLRSIFGSRIKLLCCDICREDIYIACTLCTIYAEGG